MWSGPLSSGRVALLLWNRSSKNASITATYSDIGIEYGTSVTIRDVWKVGPSSTCAFTTNVFSEILVSEMMRILIVDGVDVQHETIKNAVKLQQITQTVPSHEVKMFVITPTKHCDSTKFEQQDNTQRTANL